MLPADLDLAEHGWQVFPLAGKTPMLVCPVTRTLRRRGSAGKCPGECGSDGHGVKDATSNLDKVEQWWSRLPGANIGARVPAPLFVIDVDPRHDGHHALADLERVHGPLPETLTVTTGRGDGGTHRYFLHPGGRLTQSRLPAGLELKTAAGYCVVPPSIHPEGARAAYRWADLLMPAEAPAWLVALLRPERRISPPRWSHPGFTGSVRAGSVAASFDAATSWATLLNDSGWTCLDSDPDRDGARWRHPAATNPMSATVRHGCLFVYSPNTEFGPDWITLPGAPRGLTRFRAYALLHHHGNGSAAARALRKGTS